MLHRNPRRAAALLASALVAVSTGAAAEQMGSLAGVVEDAVTQKPVSDAVVTAHGPALVGEQSVATDDQGAFEITMLPAGTYGLTVKRDGFQTFAPEGIIFKGHQLRVRIALLPESAVEKPAPPPPPLAEVAAVEFNERSMTAPAMISGPSPAYTPEAIERGIEGAMQVRCVVTTEGRVRHCRILKGLPFMDRAVLESLEQRRYHPALAQGKPVDVFYTFNLRLKLPAQ